jgi:hypothetical protein
MGYNNGTVSSSHWNSDVYTIGIGSGTTTGTNVSGLTTAQMQTASSFSGFTFSATPGAAGSNWVIVNADGSLNSSGVSGGGTFPMLASEYSNTINNAHQLQLMAMNLAASYTLGSNIDAAETAASMDVWGSAGFAPIGNSTANSFTGTFDGLNHTISSLTINRPSAISETGLFGYTAGAAVVKNVGILNGNVIGGVGNFSGGGTGGLVGRNGGTISASYFTGSVSGAGYVGGLAGNNSGNISNSHTEGNVTGTGQAIGGLVGGNSGAVNNSYSTVNVTAATAQFVGGLIGATNYGSVSSSYATGSVSGKSFVGGLEGYFRGTTSNSYATGAVSGVSVVGGLIGEIDFGANGGSGILSNSYSTGSVSGTSIVGGLIGSIVAGSVSNSFWDKETSNQPTTGLGSGSTTGLTGLTTAQMKTASTFTNAGWSSSIWNLSDGSYPTLVGNQQVSVVLVDTWFGTSGDWFSASNWSLGYVPTSLTDVVISAAGLQTITLTTGTAFAKSLTCDENFTLSGGSLSVAGASTFTSGILAQSAGTLTLNGASSIANLELSGGTLNGSGSLSVTQSYLNNSGVLGATFSSINITQTIGNLAVGSMGATGAIHLTATAGGITFNGLINAGSNSVNLTAAGTITENTGGGITAAGLSTSAFGGTTLTGANAVGSFTANDSSGAVTFANTAPSLVLNGIFAYGLKVLNAGGDITVNSSIMNSNGNVGLLAGWDGNLTTPGVALGTGNITLNSNVASLGNLSMLAGNSITLNNPGVSLGSISITHNASWGTFTNSHSGNYISNGALSLLAGGAINIGSNVGVGVLGIGNATIIAGWDGNAATPGVVSYAAGKNVTINGGVGSASSGNVTLKAADAIIITPTVGSTNNMVGIDMNSGTLSLQADKISLVALGGNGPSVQANIYSNGDQSFVLTGGSGVTSKLSLAGGDGANAWGGSAQINRFGSATGGQNFTFNNGSSLELKGGNGGGFVTAHTWSGTCDGYFGVLCSGNNANIENQAPGGQTFTFSSGSNLTLIGGSVGNSNNANISNQVGVQTITGNPVMSIAGGSSGGAMYYNNGTDPWVGADTQIRDQYLDNSAGIDSKDSQVINAASIALNGGSAAFGSAYLGAPAQTITTTGNVTLSGGTAAAPTSFTSFGKFIHTDAALIGNDAAAAPQLNIGGSLTLTSGAVSSFGGSAAMIGSLMSTADVLVTAVGNITLNAGSAFYVGAGAINLGSTTGTVAVSGEVTAGTFTLSSGIWNQVASTLPNFTVGDFSIAGGTFIRALGGNGTSAAPYQLADIYGVQGVGSAGMLGKVYTLANNIDATGTVNWNAGAGFVPVGNASLSFSGGLDGLGHTISNLSINRPDELQVGLFSATALGASISNIGLTGGTIRGNYYVGGLVGYNAGTVNNSYSNVNISGNLYYIGGLVGWNNGTVSSSHATAIVQGNGNSVGGLVGYNHDIVVNSYATGSVSGGAYAAYCVGGLVGNSVGTISNSYATGNASGIGYAIGGLIGQNGGTINNSYATGSTLSTSSGQVGGLVGYNGGTINNSYASGSVAGNFQLGGLVGYNYNYGTPGIINNSFWNKETTLQTVGADGSVGIAASAGLTTAQMELMSSFTGWDIANVGGAGKIWRIYEGHTAPMLTSFLTPLTLSGGADATVTYNGASQSGANVLTVPNGVLGTAASGINVGFYNGYYSAQQGFDLIGGNLTITPYAVSMTGSRAYDGTTTAASNIFTLGPLVSGETLTLSGSGSVASPHVSAGSQSVTLGTLALVGNGSNGTGLASNYTFTGGSQTATITATPVTVTATIGGASTKVYDGTTIAIGSTLIGSVTGGLSGETLNITGLTLNYNSEHVATANTISATGTAGLSISGGTAGSLASDYSFTPPTITPVSGNISALGNYTLNGVNGNWSTASTWSGLGGILPAAGDVLGVTIAANSTVTFDAAASNTTLQTLTNAGSFILNGNNLSIGSYSQSAGTLSGSGNLTVTNSFSQTGGTISLSGAALADITQATGDLSIVSLSAPTVNLTASTGSILGQLTAVSAQLTADKGIGSANSPFQLIASNLNATTTSGGINLANTPTSAVTLIDFKTGDASSVMYAQNGQDLTLTGTMSSVGGTVTIDPPVNFSMSNTAQVSSAGGAIGVQANGNVVLASVNAGSGAIGLTSGGNVTAATGFTGPSLIGGITTLNIGGNAKFSTQVQSLGGTVNGTLTVTDTGGVTFTGTVGSSNAPIVAVQQVITMSLEPPPNPTIPPNTSDADKAAADKAAADKAAADKAAAMASNSNGSTGTSSQNSSNSSGSTIGGTQGSFAESEPIDTGSTASVSSTSAKSSDGTAEKGDSAKKEEDSKKNNGKNNSKDKPNAKPEKC